MSLAAGGGKTATRETERWREKTKKGMQTNSQQGGFMTCSQWSVEREEGSTDRWEDTVFSAKSSLILSAQISHPHPLHLPASCSYSLAVTAALIYPYPLTF